MDIISLTKKRKQSKPSICFVTCEYPPDQGGVSKSAKRIVKFLTAAGLDVHVFAPARDGQYSFKIVDDVALYRVPNGKGFYRKCSLLIQSIDNVVDFEVYHGFFLFMAYSCLPFVVKKNKPLITSIRGIELDWIMNRPPYSKMGHQILCNSSWVTSVSSASLAIASEVVNIDDRSSFIPNSIDVAAFEPWRLNNQNHSVVGTVCTFREKKNIPLLIKAYHLVSPNLRRKLLLVGDFHAKHKKAEASIKDTIRNLKIENEIEITGYVENSEVAKYLRAMHIFVLSSDSEGLPNAVLEAAAAGVPIVSTAVDGINDIFTNGVNALLVSRHDSVEMSMAIEQVLSDSSLCEKLALGARELAKKFNLEIEQKHWLSLYNNFISF